MRRKHQNCEKSLTSSGKRKLTVQLEIWAFETIAYGLLLIADYELLSAEKMACRLNTLWSRAVFTRELDGVFCVESDTPSRHSTTIPEVACDACAEVPC